MADKEAGKALIIKALEDCDYGGLLYNDFCDVLHEIAFTYSQIGNRYLAIASAHDVIASAGKLFTNRYKVREGEDDE